MKRRSCLLRPRHFDHLDVDFSSGGLSGAMRISRDDREHDANFGFSASEATDLDRIDSLRPYTTIILNPRQSPVSTLAEKFEAASAQLAGKDDVRPSYGLPDQYDLQWKLRKCDDLIREGQHIVLVAFDKKEPVGHASLHMNLYHPDENEAVAELSVNLELVYVVPSRRSQGYGLDLSIACGKLCESVFEACYRAIPPRTTLRSCISADLITNGGETFALHLRDCLECRTDMLSEFGRRHTVEVTYPEFNAGF